MSWKPLDFELEIMFRAEGKTDEVWCECCELSGEKVLAKPFSDDLPVCELCNNIEVINRWNGWKASQNSGEATWTPKK